jgi:hypothetical protein
MAEARTMKKLLATITCLVALTVAAVPVSAQKRQRYSNRAAQTRYNQRYNDAYRDRVYRERVYNDSVYGTVYNDDYYDNRSRWEKSRDKITTAAGAGGGALLGAIVGGKKGAIIGAIAGGAGAAVYTYKIRDKEPYRY